MANTNSRVSNLKVAIDVSDAIKELKALQREAKKTTQSLAEVKSDKESEYHQHISDLSDGCPTEHRFLMTNAMIYALYNEKQSGEVIFARFSGVTTSIKALEKTFDDVVYLQYAGPRGYTPDITGKVVFTDPKVRLPRGVRPKCHIHIAAVDTYDGNDNLIR